MGVTVSGKNNFNKWSGEFEKALTRALFRVGLEAEGNAKDHITENQSVDTGLLRNSITFAISGGNANISSYRATKPDKKGVYRVGKYEGTAPSDTKKAVYIGTNVEYGGFVELGSRGRAGKPFLKPAATQHSNDYKQIFTSELKGGGGT